MISEHGIELCELLPLLWQVTLLTARLQEVEQTRGEIAGMETLMEQLAAQASSSTMLADEHAQRIRQLERLASLSGTAACIPEVPVSCMRSSAVHEIACAATLCGQVLGTRTRLGHTDTYTQVVSPDAAHRLCAIISA